jgi:hypothetical protein
MTELANYQFELDGVVFGKGAAISVDGEDDSFDRGTDDVAAQDTYISGTESWAFGLDDNVPAPWAWAMHTDTAEFPDTALEDLAALERAWKNPDIRLRPQAVSTLRYRVANRTRRVFGRPGPWRASLDNRIMGGLSRIECEFRRADRLYYGDEQISTDITATPADPTGFFTPLVFPLSTLAGAPRQGTIASGGGGNVPAPFEVTFYGPESGSATGIRLRATEWSLGLRGLLGPGDVLKISTFPFGPRAELNGQPTVAGLVDASVALREIRIPVEGDTLWFDSVDATGTARCVVSWYPTYDTF